MATPISHTHFDSIINSAETLQLRDNDGESRRSTGKELQLRQVMGCVDFYAMVSILVCAHVCIRERKGGDGEGGRERESERKDEFISRDDIQGIT